MAEVGDYATEQDGGVWSTGQEFKLELPREWIAWHFTPVENIARIVEAGCLVADSHVGQASSPGNMQMKAERLGKAVELESYPDSAVGDHVPFYVAAKSPMLFRVCRYGLPNYDRGPDPLVFLGFNIGKIVDAGLTWCFSDRNATSPFVEFTDDLSEVQNLLDEEVLRARIWRDTPDDPGRRTRRAAEFLVHEEVPIDLLSVSVAHTKGTANQVDTALAGYDYDGTFVLPWMYY